MTAVAAVPRFGQCARARSAPALDAAAARCSCTAYRASTPRRCRSPKISIRSVTSVRTVRTKRSAKQFARGHLTTSIPASAMTASNDAAN